MAVAGRDGALNAAQQRVFDSLYGVGKVGAQRDIMRIIGERIGLAVQWSGLDGEEIARRIGHANGTQLSLWVAGERMPPLLPLMSIGVVCSVSVDFLLGLTDEPERDPKEAARRQVLAMMRERVEGALSEVIEIARGDAADLQETKVAAANLAVATHELCHSVLRASENEGFDDVPCGAQVMRRAMDACDAISNLPRSCIKGSSTMHEAREMRNKFASRR